MRLKRRRQGHRRARIKNRRKRTKIKEKRPDQFLKR